MSDIRLRVHDLDSGEVYNVLLLNSPLLLDALRVYKSRAYDYPDEMESKPPMEFVRPADFDKFDSERLSVIRCVRSASGVYGFEIHGITREVLILPDMLLEEAEKILSKALVSLCEIEI